MRAEETVYYRLNQVLLSGGQPMSGLFSWTFDPDDFEGGTGEFLALDIPWTAHDHRDLVVSFDPGKSIEITLDANLHDDGVDITLFLAQPLSPTQPATLDLIRSKYEIGGNGFHDGTFLAGSVKPVPLTFTITPASPGFCTLSWQPAIPGSFLQRCTRLNDWEAAPSGSTNPVTIPLTESRRFFRVVTP